jgi:hypothetical protein
MDPLVIATRVTALANLCSEVGILCSKLGGERGSISRTLVKLRIEASAHQASLLQIKLLLIDQDGIFAKLFADTNEWTDSFDRALSGCSITLSILISKLEKGNENGIGSSWNHTLKENDLHDLTEALRGQQQGLQILISTLHL